MSENDNADLKPDPAAKKRRVSIPVVATTAVLVIASAGAAYAIGTNGIGAEEPVPVAAPAETSQSTESPTLPSPIAPTTPEPAPTTPGLLTGVPAEPSASATPSRSTVSATPSRRASSAGINQYAPTSSSYARTTDVQSTTVELPPEVAAKMSSPKATTSEVPTPTSEPAPKGQGGALVGGDKSDDRKSNPADDAESEPADRDASPAPAQPEVHDVDTPATDDEAGRPSDKRADAAPSPAPVAPPAPTSAVTPPPPAPVETEEPVQADDLEATFRAAFAPGASDAQLSSAFESGPAMIPVGRALADGLPMIGGAVQWHLAGVTGAGDTATGQLVIDTPVGQHVVPMMWVRDGEQWKISADSTCALGLALLGGCAPAA